MKIGKRIYIFLAVVLLMVQPLCGLTLKQARSLYLKGEYHKALPGFEAAYKKTPKDASVNHWLGVCLYEEGRYDEAKPRLEFAAKKNVTESPRYLAMIAYRNYDPDAASQYIDDYREALAKSKKQVPAKIEELASAVVKMSNMMQRVEKIVIIDSLHVNKTNFFEAYKLSVESGRLGGAWTLPEGFEASDEAVVYTPESGQRMIWSMNPGGGKSVLVESNELTDGTWEKPHGLGTLVNEGGNAAYPFLMNDGVTLYFANDGENSLGGYDIFITRRGDDGKLLGPQNVGMPYNSPYDDYMLAIDESAGVGWWATDRNQLGDSITIYKFIPADMRVNYAADDENLGAYARIDDYKATWPEGADYSELLSRIDNMESSATSNEEKHSTDFMLYMPDGRVLTAWAQLGNDEARALMHEYMDAADMDAGERKELQTLREKFAAGDKSVAERILQLEQKIEQRRPELRRMMNKVITAVQ